VVQWLHDNPWRQGHVLTDDTTKALGIAHPSSPDDTVAIVVSHDCDLAQDICAEPICEVILGRKINAQDGNASNAKSVRRLHITCSDGATNSIIELEISNRRSINKADLAGRLPADSTKLTVHEKSLLQVWTFISERI
jgi:hypothetical protein